MQAPPAIPFVLSLPSPGNGWLESALAPQAIGPAGPQVDFWTRLKAALNDTGPGNFPTTLPPSSAAESIPLPTPATVIGGKGLGIPRLARGAHPPVEADAMLSEDAGAPVRYEQPDRVDPPQFAGAPPAILPLPPVPTWAPATPHPPSDTTIAAAAAPIHPSGSPPSAPIITESPSAPPAVDSDVAPPGNRRDASPPPKPTPPAQDAGLRPGQVGPAMASASIDLGPTFASLWIDRADAAHPREVSVANHRQTAPVQAVTPHIPTTFAGADPAGAISGKSSDSPIFSFVIASGSVASAPPYTQVPARVGVETSLRQAQPNLIHNDSPEIAPHPQSDAGIAENIPFNQAHRFSATIPAPNVSLPTLQRQRAPSAHVKDQDVILAGALAETSTLEQSASRPQNSPDPDAPANRPMVSLIGAHARLAAADVSQAMPEALENETSLAPIPMPPTTAPAIAPFAPALSLPNTSDPTALSDASPSDGQAPVTRMDSLPLFHPARPLESALLATGPTSGLTRELSLRLHPDTLGQLHVRVIQPPAAPAEVTITVSHPDTLALLRRDTPALHVMLDQAGIQSEGRNLVLTLARAAPDTVMPPPPSPAPPNGQFPNGQHHADQHRPPPLPRGWSGEAPGDDGPRPATAPHQRDAGRHQAGLDITA